MIETVLIYLIEDDKILFMYRNKKNNDYNHGKHIGIGGHVEKNETPEMALIREVKEETNYDLLDYKKRGVIIFEFDNYFEKMHVYLSNQFAGNQKESDEGDLMWVYKKDIDKLSLFESDKVFLPILFESNKYFEYHFVYKNNLYQGVKYEKISDC